MPPNVPSLFAKPAAHAIATALSFSVGGPLAAFTGAFVGGFLGDSAVEFTRIATEKLAEAAGEGLLGDSLERLAERLRPFRPNLESIHRNALRETLAEIGREASPTHSDWFKNWDACLSSKQLLDLEELSLEKVVAANPDDLFRESLERLNVQGASIRAKSLVLGRKAEPASLNTSGRSSRSCSPSLKTRVSGSRHSTSFNSPTIVCSAPSPPVSTRQTKSLTQPTRKSTRSFESSAALASPQRLSQVLSTLRSEPNPPSSRHALKNSPTS